MGFDPSKTEILFIRNQLSPTIDIAIQAIGEYDNIQTITCTYFGISADISLNIDTVKPIIVNSTVPNVNYVNPIGTIQIGLNRAILSKYPMDTSFFVPLDASISILQIEKVNDLSYNLTVTASNEIVGTKTFQYNYLGNTTSLLLNVDTVQPKLLSYDPPRNQTLIPYTTNSGTITLTFNRTLLQDISRNNLTFHDSSLSFGSLTTTDQKIYSLVVNSYGEYDKEKQISYSYFDDSSTIYCKIDTIIPRLSAVKPILNYRDTSGTIDLLFDRPLLNDFFTFTTDSSLSLSSLTKVSDSDKYLIHVQTVGEFTGTKQFTLTHQGINNVVTFENLYLVIPSMISIVSDTSLILFDASSSIITITFDKPLLENDEIRLTTNINNATDNYYNLELISNENRTVWKYLLTVKELQVQSLSKEIVFYYYGKTIRINIDIDTRVPSIQSFNVENLLYSDVSSQIVVEINDPYQYFLKNNIDLRQNIIVSNPETLQLFRDSFSDNQIRGHVMCPSGVYLPNASARLFYNSAKFSLDSTVTFLVDTRYYKADFSLSRNITYLNPSGLLSVQFQPEIVDVCLNHIFVEVNGSSLSRSVSEIAVFNGNHYSLQLQKVTNQILLLSVSGEIDSSNVRIQYNEQLHPSRDDLVIEYRLGEIQLHVDTVIPSILDISFNKSQLTYLDTNADLQIEFDRPVLNDSIHVSTNQMGTSLSSFDPISGERKVWRGNMSVFNQWENRVTATVEFYGKTKDTNLNVFNYLPEISGNILLSNDIHYMDTSCAIQIQFKHNVYDSSSSLSSLFSISDISNGSMYLFTLQPDNLKQWSGRLDLKTYQQNNGIDISMTRIVFQYEDAVFYSPFFSLNTQIPQITDFSLNTNKLTFDVSSTAIRVRFSKPLLAMDPFSVSKNFSFTKSSQFYKDISPTLTNLEETDRQEWTSRLSASELLYKAINNQITINYFDISYNQLVTFDTARRPRSNICFPAGEMVLTDTGYKCIETVVPGLDTIGGKSIVCVTETQTDDGYLVFLPQNACSLGVPNKDTLISGNHKVVWRGEMVDACNIGAEKVPYKDQILYNILLEEHGIMVVNGMEVETLHPQNNIAKLYRLMEQSQYKGRMVELFNEMK